MANWSEMIQIALRRGESNRGNRNITVCDLRSVQMLYPLPVYVAGLITCQHYDHRILAVDLERCLVTDFGMARYSHATGENINNAFAAIGSIYPVVGRVCWRYGAWMLEVPNRKGVKRKQDAGDVASEAMCRRFMDRVPWVVRRDGTNWFHWPSYDTALAEQLFQAQGFLNKDQNWRYWTFDWDDQGNWTRRFIDADAERRWKNRAKKVISKSA